MATQETNPVLPGAELVGYGFNIFGKYDESSKTYLILDKGQTQTIEVNGNDFQSYSNLNVTLQNSSDTVYESFSNRSDIEKSMAESAGLDISVHTFLAGTFKGEVNSNYSSISNSEEQNYYLVSKTNKKLWSVSGGKPNIMQYADIASLPRTFDPQKPEPFFRAIQKYGAYYIKEVFVGAYMHYYEAINQSFCSDQTSASISAKAEYESLFTKDSASGQAEWGSLSENWKTNRQSKCKVVGGIDPGLGVVASPSTYQNFSALFQQWTNSINQGNGVPMHFTLAPVYELFDDIALQQAFQQAASAYLSNSFSIQYSSNNRSVSIVAGGQSLLPQNSFPTLKDMHNPSVWVVVMNRQNLNIEMNLLFPIASPSTSVFPLTPDQMDRNDYQQRIYQAINKYSGSEKHMILLSTYDVVASTAGTAPITVMDNLNLNNFISNAGGGSAFEQWKNSWIASYGVSSAYLLAGVIAGGPNQGVDYFKFNPALYGAFIPSLNNGDVLFSPTLVGYNAPDGFSSGISSGTSEILPQQTGGNNFKIELKASAQNDSQILFNGTALSPQNGFPILPQGDAYNGFWIIIVEIATGDLIFNVFFDTIAIDLDRIYNALSVYGGSNGKYLLSLVSTSGSKNELFASPLNTNLGRFLLSCGASESALTQWNYDMAHSGQYISCNYAMAGIIGNGPGQGYEVYNGVQQSSGQSATASVTYPAN